MLYQSFVNPLKKNLLKELNNTLLEINAPLENSIITMTVLVTTEVHAVLV